MSDYLHGLNEAHDMIITLGEIISNLNAHHLHTQNQTTTPLAGLFQASGLTAITLLVAAQDHPEWAQAYAQVALAKEREDIRTGIHQNALELVARLAVTASSPFRKEQEQEQ